MELTFKLGHLIFLVLGAAMLWSIIWTLWFVVATGRLPTFLISMAKKRAKAICDTQWYITNKIYTKHGYRLTLRAADNPQKFVQKLELYAPHPSLYTLDQIWPQIGRYGTVQFVYTPVPHGWIAKTQTCAWLTLKSLDPH